MRTTAKKSSNNSQFVNKQTVNAHENKKNFSIYQRSKNSVPSLPKDSKKLN